MQDLKIGERVTWNTGGRGCTAPRYQRTGNVTEIVTKGKIPTTYTDGKYTLRSRDHESYVVTVGKQLYWPRVSVLKVAGLQEGE